MCHYLIIRKFRAPEAIAVILLAIVFAADVYRAAMQSMTIDEAFTYNLYLSKPVRDLLTYYDANNHVLYTVLAKIAIGIFGNAEWVLRLPSLLGALLYLIAIYKLCCLFIRDSWLRLPALALLSLNPYLMDFQSAARGYGLGIALMFWGLYWMLSSKLVRAGFAFGLAIACSLTLAFPVAAFATVFWAANRNWRVIDELGVPMVVSAFVLLAVPLSHATKESFYVGTQTLRGTMDSLAACSFRHHPTSFVNVQNAAVGWTPWMLGIAAFVSIAALWWARNEYRILAAGFALNLAMLVGAHVIAGLKYPELRTGLYLIPIASLLVVAAIAAVPIRTVRLVLAIPIVVVCCLYAVQWNTSMYTEWQWDITSRQVAKLMRDRQPRRVAASWELVEALNYYRDRYRMKDLQPLTRANPDGDFDMYALLPENYDVVAKRGLRGIYRDARSQVVVAIPAGAR